MAASVGLAVVALSSAACASNPNVFPTAPAGPSPKAGPTSEVTTRQVAGLGRVLVDGHGYTLYLFVPDQRSSRSVCSGVCALQWPPLLLPDGVTAPIAGPGVEPSLLSVTDRPDGGRQVVYHGWPLYLWPPDTEPGQATGQGLNNLGGLWYVVDAAGNAVH
jgi:predicted lipoprotein with Yx(FWY)xxD motif